MYAVSVRKNPPKIYTEIHVEYILRGTDLQEKDIEQAIQLSEEKYCSVGAMLGKSAKIYTSFKVLTLNEISN